MDLTQTAYGTWSGGRFMHFGEALSDDRFIEVIRLAYTRGIRTFMTADVYGLGQADEMLGRALAGLPRDSYCLVGAIGHDFYTGQREGAKGYPRFTDLTLRKPADYASYLRMAAEKSLARCQAAKFDCLLLHNPDATGYASDTVWKGMEKLMDAKLTDRVGIAPGPANGFTLDIILNFERFAGLVSWAMVILNPLEPWPGKLCLAAAEKQGVKIITRVVDYGGLFHDDVKPGHLFGKQDHRTFRPAGWVEEGNRKIDRMRAVAQKNKLSLLQLACVWNLGQPAVQSVIPTLIQEISTDAKPIEQKVEELATLPQTRLIAAESEFIERLGDNQGCMALKGGNPEHQGEPLPDRWGLTPELLAVAQRWNIDPAAQLTEQK
ncbi:MAG: aldo/keto reductase [Verrucomicrobiota bacterium]